MEKMLVFIGWAFLCTVLWCVCCSMEKMISGMYMGEIVRLVLERLTMEGLLFRSVDTECDLFERGRFYTKYVSEIEGSESDCLSVCFSEIEKLSMSDCLSEIETSESNCLCLSVSPPLRSRRPNQIVCVCLSL